MRISLKAVRNVALSYMALPTILFFAFTLKLWIGLPVVMLIAYALARSFKSRETVSDVPLVSMCEPAEEIRMKPWVAVLLLMGVVIWCVLAGQGGFVCQTWDWNGRNATLRDLVFYDWPVIYRDGELALAYYVGHWIPAALVGKLALLFSFGSEAVWRIANVALLAWTAIGVAIAVMLLHLLLRAGTSRRQLFLFLVLVFFDGLQLIGIWIAETKAVMTHQSVVPWGWFFQFTSNSAQLYWVFNQAVIPWIATFLLFSEKGLSRFAFLLSLVLLCGPLPATGIAFYMALIGFCALWHALRKYRIEGVLRVVRDAASPENLIGVSVVVPLVLLYLGTNVRNGSFHPAWLDHDRFFIRYVSFVLVETGLFFLVTAEFRNVLWWGTAFWLCFCPLFSLGGNGVDFCMRASIPALLVLMIFCARTVFQSARWRCCLMMILLAIAARNGFVTIRAYLYQTIKCWPDVCNQDRIYSYSRRIEDIPRVDRWDAEFPTALTNNHCQDPYGHFFYKYLARIPEPTHHLESVKP